MEISSPVEIKSHTDNRVVGDSSSSSAGTSDRATLKTWSENPTLAIVQLVILTGVIIHCFISIWLKSEPKELYFGLLGWALGALLPNPKIKKKKSNGNGASILSHITQQH